MSCVLNSAGTILVSLQPFLIELDYLLLLPLLEQHKKYNIVTKLSVYLPCEHSNSLLGIYPKTNESIYLQKHLDSNIQRYFSQNFQTVKAAYMCISKWMDEQNMVYPLNGLLLSN